MALETPQFSRTRVDKAGRVLRDPAAAAQDLDGAFRVLANWRAAHAFPLNTLTMDLRQKVRRLKGNFPVVQRLKRARSVVSKLTIESSMRLSQMQDIGGCRAVLPSLSDVAALRAQYAKGRSYHLLVEETDYVTSPKATGYRSLHLIYRFRSRSKSELNGLLIEVQLRTRLQHAWATAVETVSAVVGQALKSNQGERAWRDFFRNASAAFALIEKTNPVPGAPRTKAKLARQISSQMKNLRVRDKLDAYRKALRVVADSSTRPAAYYLLVLRPDLHQLRIHAYSRRRLESAYKEYGRLEADLPLRATGRQALLFPDLSESSGPQVVLVGAESLKSLKDSYPNYYADTEIFLRRLEGFVSSNRRGG